MRPRLARASVGPAALQAAASKLWKRGARFAGSGSEWGRAAAVRGGVEGYGWFVGARRGSYAAVTAVVVSAGQAPGDRNE